MHFDLKQIIQAIGYPGLFAIVFAESGLFFGFILPGDSLLVTAGLLATQGYFNILFLLPLLILAAILGDSVGYWTGKKFGPRIFSKNDGLLFNKNHIDTASEFYETHGVKTIIIARFLPYVRTFAPIVAGIGKMKYSQFLTFNIAGGTTWVTLMLLIGYFLGRVVPNVDKYLIPLILVIIIVSFIPSAYEHRKKISFQVKNFLKKN
ncbi:MAG TPA: DedA family protein [Candidatus Saccharimonadales bacterium]|nr:DedA family protein [Candidatus Saccharimonadales bacterium]